MTLRNVGYDVLSDYREDFAFMGACGAIMHAWDNIDVFDNQFFNRSYIKKVYALKGENHKYAEILLEILRAKHDNNLDIL